MNLNKECGLKPGAWNMVNKKYIFLILTLIVSITVAYKRSYEQLEQKMVISIFQPKETITSLNNKRNLDNFPVYYIDQLRFPRNKEITHYKLGKLGFQKNIHVDIEMWVNVLVEGDYEFHFETDSGLGIQLDDLPMSSHLFLDELQHLYLTFRLTKGQHKITLIKIHREKEFVIEADYRLKNSKTSYNIGESSDLLEFIELDLWNE